MTLVVDVLAAAARQCSIDEPSSWVSTTEEDAVALRDDFLVQEVEDILDRFDLPPPIGAQARITGSSDATDAGFTLPDDFRRLQRDCLAVYETQPSRRVCVPISTEGEWTHIQEVGLAGVNRFYKLAGYAGNWAIDFYQELPDAGEVKVSYITNNWMVDSGGTKGGAFTDPGDILLFPRKLVEAGIVWRFRERNGLPFEGKFLEHERLAQRMSNDRNARRSVVFSEDATVRQPWDVPVPDYIPAS